MCIKYNCVFYYKKKFEIKMYMQINATQNKITILIIVLFKNKANQWEKLRLINLFDFTRVFTIKSLTKFIVYSDHDKQLLSNKLYLILFWYFWFLFYVLPWLLHVCTSRFEYFQLRVRLSIGTVRERHRVTKRNVMKL